MVCDKSSYSFSDRGPSLHTFRHMSPLARQVCACLCDCLGPSSCHGSDGRRNTVYLQCIAFESHRNTAALVREVIISKWLVLLARCWTRLISAGAGKYRFARPFILFSSRFTAASWLRGATDVPALLLTTPINSAFYERQRLDTLGNRGGSADIKFIHLSSTSRCPPRFPQHERVRAIALKR